MATTPTVGAPSSERVTRGRGVRLVGRPRRLLRAAHVAAAGAWLGLVVAMLTLGVTAQTSGVAGQPAATYRLMARLGGAVIPPIAVATLATGLALSLLTPWGLVRHWWVVVKGVLGLAVIVTAVTLTDAFVARAIASVEADPRVGARLIGSSTAHLVMLTVATVVSVDKPWGRTPMGRLRRRRPRTAPSRRRRG